MRIPRLYHPEPINLETEFALFPETAHHVATVLRLKANHPVVLFNGDGNEYSAQLISVARREVIVEADACLELSKESALPLHLGQGVSKGDRMETVIQKAVELGVTEITPLITERCAVKLDEKRWEKKISGWEKLIISACEQCGRNRLPILNPPKLLKEWVSESTQATRLTLSPDAESPLAKTPYNTHGYRLLIGPEGGLSSSEVHLSEECGFMSCSLGPRVLRTETAAITSLSVLQAIHGDL